MMPTWEPISMNFYETTVDGGTSFRNLIKYANRIFSSRCNVTVTLRSKRCPYPLIQQAVFSRQVYKDDVNCCSSTSDICFMSYYTFMGLCYYIYTHAKGSTLH